MTFPGVFFESLRIRLMPECAFLGKDGKLSEERAVYRIQSGPPLAGAFEQVLQRVAVAPAGVPGRILAAFAASLVQGVEFNLAQIEQLSEPADRALCLELFDYCMRVGLSEDERRAASAAFAPFVEIHAPGTRH
jgi:hypothetical protein